ncbi:MAG TPA: FAD-binding oxidoreductase, partial [Actinomycetota bacterium]|nr:FAD-binding oxidoreductase [Actinomycetota bacterium]
MSTLAGVDREAFAQVLRSRMRGDVRTDRIARALYATDASPYRIEPFAVARPAEPDDIAAVVQTCREHSVPITARGAGTSLSGQCVGAGLQLDLSLLDRIESIEPEARTARVQPGVTWWQLNRALRVHGLEFGPDPATKRQCTLGGVVGTNAGGTHSIVYGAAVDHVRTADAVLADGSRVTFGPTMDRLPDRLRADLLRIRDETTPLLDDRFRTLARRGSGYQLEHLCVPHPNPAKLLAGSDGTLALMTSVEVTLDELPAVRVLGVVGFPDMHAAIDAVPALVDTSPCAVELVSQSLLDVARSSAFHGARVRDIDPSLGGLLFVEYQGASLAEAEAGLDRMERVVAGAPFVGRYTDVLAATAMWEVREAGVGAL